VDSNLDFFVKPATAEAFDLIVTEIITDFRPNIPGVGTVNLHPGPESGFQLLVFRFPSDNLCVSPGQVCIE
jgi:hypothetical protein